MAFDISALMSEASKAGAIAPKRKIENIPIDQIDPSPNNSYSMDGIEELAASIETLGLLQPALLRRRGERFEVISGHRRREACLLLGWTHIDCEVMQSNDDIMTELRLLMANATARTLTDADKVFQAERLSELLQAIKKSGTPLGMRIREAIASIMRTSLGQIGRYQHISTHLLPEWRKEFDAGNIKISSAYDVSRQTPEEQSEMLDAYKTTGEIVFPELEEILETAIERHEATYTETDTPPIVTEEETEKPTAGDGYNAGIVIYDEIATKEKATKPTVEKLIETIQSGVDYGRLKDYTRDLVAEGLRYGIASGKEITEAPLLLQVAPHQYDRILDGEEIYIEDLGMGRRKRFVVMDVINLTD